MNNGILFITPVFVSNKGGLARSSARVTQILKDLGYRVTIVEILSEETSGMLVRSNAARIKKKGNFRVIEISLAQKEFTDKMNYIIQQLKYQKFDLIISFYLNMTTYIAVQLKKILNVPLVAVGHGSDINVKFFSLNDQTRQFFNEIFSYSDHIVFVSNDLRKKAVFYFGEIEKKSSVIHNSFAPFQHKKKNLSTEDFFCNTYATIGCVGELSYKKGTDLLFPCLQRLREELKVNILMIGNYKDQTKKIFEFKSTGTVEDKYVLNYIELLDIVLFSSRVEGCPNTLIEAMALGKIVVANDIPALREIIINSKNGFLVDFSHPENVARLVKKIIQNKESYRYISLNAKRTIKDCFNIDRETALWKTLLSSLLNN